MTQFSRLFEVLKKANPTCNFMDKTFTNLNEILLSSEIKHVMEYMCFFVQSYVCSQLEELDLRAKFTTDRWLKPDEHGGGVTCVMQNGDVIEKGGVNLSVIAGQLTKECILQMRSRGHNIDDGYTNFCATGISSVIHPLNPHSPTMHFNFRYFEIEPKSPNELPVFWFGGGIDITPSYVYKEDIVHFHTILKEVCDRHNPLYYEKFKKWADEYFFIPHRGETRGLGGIFFDDLTCNNPAELLEFIFDCALSVVPAYIPILRRTMNLPYTDKELEWKLIRRGRYVEFNTIYDRGTKFGLCVAGSRIESILMSLPPYAKWAYCHTPNAGSREEELLKYTKNPVDWVSLSG